MIGMRIHNDSQIIDRLGGNAALAAVFDISSQYVTKWRRTGIPKSYRMYLELAHPEAFKQDDKQAA